MNADCCEKAKATRCASLNWKYVMRLEITGPNWLEILTEAIENANDGDTLILPNHSQAAIGERMRMQTCPEKDIDFEYETDDLEDLND